jgi:hypothetical protein
MSDKHHTSWDIERRRVDPGVLCECLDVDHAHDTLPQQHLAAHDIWQRNLACLLYILPHNSLGVYLLEPNSRVTVPQAKLSYRVRQAPPKSKVGHAALTSTSTSTPKHTTSNTSA